MSTETVLETQGLRVRFGGVTVLDGVDFKLGRRELRCLIGPNGAGKSTFFKCLSGQLIPTEGDIWLRGERCTGFHPHWIARQGVGIKTQVPSLMGELSVFENIWLAARRGRNTTHAHTKTTEMLERLQLQDIQRSTVNTLAHGKRQIVEFGVVLAGEPSLILLDEPTAGMTSAEIETMVSLIRDINRSTTMVVVEHDMHFIRMIADVVTVLHQGQVLIEADVHTVLNDPSVRSVYLGKQV